jgi:hypothetical protein
MLVAGIAFSGRAGVAQDMSASPAAGESHPAHIHLGTCDALGEVVYPLADLTHDDASATPMAGMTMATPAAGGDVESWSETDVQAGLDEIIAGGHAINVHESMANIQNYIACGEVTGTPADGALTIELHELNGSGYEGSATLTDNGDGTTTVHVELRHVSAMATPTA